MLNKTITYRSLMRFIGTLFVLYGLYLIVCALTAQVIVGGAVQYNGPLLFWNPAEVGSFIFWGGFLGANPILPMPRLVAIHPYILPGPFLYIGIGILCLGFMSMRVKVMYWCLQVAFWCISLSLWLSIITIVNHGSFSLPDDLTFLFWGTLALSLGLLVAYKPVTSLLRRLL